MGDKKEKIWRTEIKKIHEAKNVNYKFWREKMQLNLIYIICLLTVELILICLVTL